MQLDMLMAEWTFREAENAFSALVNAALAGEPQLVTRRGVPAAVVLSADEYDRLCRAAKSDVPTLSQLLLEIPQDDGEFQRLSLPERGWDA